MFFFFVMFTSSFIILYGYFHLWDFSMVWSSKKKGRYRDSLVAAHAAMVDNPQLGFSW